MTQPISQDRFYFHSFIVLAVLSLGGFVPSFFLRPDDDPLPIWMDMHGVLFTLYFFVTILQSWLILKNKRVLHRELGVIALIIVTSAFILTLIAGANLTATGAHMTGGPRFNAILTSAFTCCVLVGVYFRRKPEIHKRLVLMATVLLTVPGFDRLIQNISKPIFPSITPKDAQMVVALSATIFIGLMIYRDVKQFNRPSFAIVLGFVCFFAGGMFGNLFVDSDLWTAMVASFAPPGADVVGVPH